MKKLDLEDNLIKNARALVYKIENGQKFFLLTQEPGDFFTVPGGCKELGDDDIVCTIKRELKEELKLDELDYELVQIKIEKVYKNLYTDPDSERYNLDTLTNIFLVKILNDNFLESGCEIQDVKWFSEEEVHNKLNREHMREIFKIGIAEI